MRPARGGSSHWTAIATFTVIAVIAAGILAYAYLGEGGRTTTSSTMKASTAPLLTFAADAYAVEATALLDGFSQSTGVQVAPVKSAGSFADANQIAAGAPDDLFISIALSATGPQYLKNLSSNWAVGFASDEMVLAYSNGTAASNVAALGASAMKSNSTGDWNAFFTSLASGSVKVGISDPLADPAGLRGWLTLEAAGFIYSGGNQEAYTSALLRSGGNVTGAHAAALVAPLESGQIQFLFIYRSAAVADHLPYVSLDRHINFGDPTLGPLYSEFTYADSAGVNKGAPIILCVTVPLSSGNEAEALQFVQYVVKNTGTLSAYGLQPFSPARLYSNVTPPSPISELVSQGLLVQAGSL